MTAPDSYKDGSVITGRLKKSRIVIQGLSRFKIIRDLFVCPTFGRHSEGARKKKTQTVADGRAR